MSIMNDNLKVWNSYYGEKQLVSYFLFQFRATAQEVPYFIDQFPSVFLFIEMKGTYLKALP